MMSKNKILRQNVGIDIAKKTFVACFGVLLDSFDKEFRSSKEFENNETGFAAFVIWFTNLIDPTLPLEFTMEATGVYHECLAHYLYERSYEVSVVLATQSKNFRESRIQNSKNDYLDAQSLVMMGLERKLPKWEPLSPFYKELKDLTRERNALVKDKTVLTNRIKALEAAKDCSKLRLKLVEERLYFIKKQIKQLEKAIRKHLMSRPAVKQKVEHLLSVPGVGLVVAATVLAETNGFGNIKNKKQLIAYAGLGLKENQSGDMKGKNKIMKKGNKHIRRVFYFTPYVAKENSQSWEKHYDRIKESYQSGRVACNSVARKMLGVMYALWKNNVPYDPEYNLGGNEAPQ